jgi:hypothetical protein
VFRLKLRCLITLLDVDASGTSEARVAQIARDLVFLKEKGDSLGQRRHDGVLALQQGGEVKLDLADFNAVSS